jgi:hypothetical protein
MNHKNNEEETIATEEDNIVQRIVEHFLFMKNSMIEKLIKVSITVHYDLNQNIKRADRFSNLSKS